MIPIKLKLAIIIAIAAISGVAAAGTFIVEDGQPRAEIVIAADAKRMAALGALELQYYLEKMTGARLPIVTETDDRFPVKIYVGESDYTRQLGVTADDLEYEAFRMVSGDRWLALVGEDLDFEPPEPFAGQPGDIPRAEAEWYAFLASKGGGEWGYPFRLNYKEWWNPRGYDETMTERYGADTKHVWNPRSLEYSRDYQGPGAGAGFWYQDRGGSLNAVCEFLRSLGVRWYMPHEVGEVVPKLNSVALPEIDETVLPDFPVRTWVLYNYNTAFFPDLIWAKRLGMNHGDASLGYARTAHLYEHRLVYERMQESNPEFFALIRGERAFDHNGHGMACYSSEGLAEETVRFAKFMYDHLDQPAVSIWPADGFRMCECELCEGKTPSEAVWGFVDRVARELYETHPDRMVLCGAYTSYVEPPPNMEEFTPNVLVFIANRGRALIDHPEHWKSYWDQMEAWRSMTAPGRIIRGENNRHGLRGSRGVGKPDFPVIHPRQMAADLAALKGISIGECGEVSQTGGRWAAPGCDHLALYVQARFLWDVDQDVEAILAEYYKQFYGPAADEMETALEFAQEKYSRTDVSTVRGRTNPQNVPLADRVKLLELLAAAREAAGDTVYGQRIDVIIGELPELALLQQELEVLREKGDPRADAPQIIAYKQGDDTRMGETYKLEHRLFRYRAPPEVDTTFSVSWTEKSLIFDIRCEEPDMESIKIGESVWEGDSIVLIIESPYHSYYQIEVDPNGRIFDADRSTIVRWQSMADVKVEKGDDYWRAIISIPVALVGEEGAEGDPMNYVVAPRIQPGSEWFFNLARRHPREGDHRHSLQETYVLCREEGRLNRTIHNPDIFAKLIFKEE